MSTIEANKQLIERWFREVWNNKRADLIDEMMAPVVRGYGLNNDPKGVMQSSGDFKSYYSGFLQAIPDIHISVEDTIAEGDKVAARLRVTGTHTGDGLGVAPANNRIDFTGTVFIRIENGKMVEGWNNFNFHTMFEQISQARFAAKLPE